MQLKIDSKIFDFSLECSKGLISGLKLLSNCGYQIFADISLLSPETIYMLKREDILINDSVDGIKLVSIIGDKIMADGNYYDSFETLTNYLIERKAIVIRNTKETKIKINLNIDGTGEAKINTGLGFFNHMLEQIARHANINLEIEVDGDLNVDEHHTVEDTGLALGEAIKKCIGNKKGIRRYGFLLPMDDSIAKCAIDLGGRYYLNYKCKFKREMVGDFPTELTEEFFKSIAAGMSATLYLRAKGKNDHHKIESMFKAFAKALNEACRYDSRTKNQLPSTKGVL